MNYKKEIHFDEAKKQTRSLILRIYQTIFFLGKWGIVFLLSYVDVTSAQEYAFRNYSIVQGLSESVVNTLIQDEKGYIWMGTGFGLNRFDGHDFTIYLQEDGLKSTQINILYRGIDDKIWIGLHRVFIGILQQTIPYIMYQKCPLTQ